MISFDESNKENSVVIVGSGMLDQNLDVLAKVQHNCTIVASGSSIGSLLRSGVVPCFA